ncbi:hypothetical protein LTR10_013838 [Elasticomyces elasticus]|uniref:CENP-V/GFA domain-containing protein n=1 Tax=Exophiala sideris TaxID=1016849 RepID=A0ABR0JGA1_9EURO|nr:hypothetical protein LTR10_013838 [Elasticomyces elasticus]KAK5033184.1 hypothetical protein LTS07_003485 [Exophiala sideris]KAK5042316.1 hypothetical protein LTR13_002122 [Exophiala sideris]KAK5063728.1 hypothetical protein LTR69_003493 [Exophiala sideris]KAK5185583.1 hypothetical protein LTR44_002572 [Eurotiomycetes sp. CCFEE 6388]
MTDLSKVTSTCYCGAVQLEYSIEGDNLITSFICHCTDDRKITSSVHASNFVIKDDTLKHVRGQDNLTKYERKHGIATGDQMDSYFCKTCGSLLYRVSSGFPGTHILRLGAVDDFSLYDGALRPRVAQFCKDRVAWAEPCADVKQDPDNVLKPE